MYATADTLVELKPLPPPVVSVSVGKIKSHPSGIGWIVVLSDGTECVGDGDTGLTKEAANRLIEAIQLRQQCRK